MSASQVPVCLEPRHGSAAICLMGGFANTVSVSSCSRLVKRCNQSRLQVQSSPLPRRPQLPQRDGKGSGSWRQLR